MPAILIPSEPYLDCIFVNVNFPDVLEDSIHGSSVVKLHFKLHTLSSHFNGHKDIDQGLGNVFTERVLSKQLLSVISVEHA